MDERIFAQQIEQTGDLLDLLKDSTTLREIIQVETECGGEIGAGFPAYSSQTQPIVLEQLTAMRRKVRLHSIVFSEFAELIQSANLGAGTEAAIAEGRVLLHHHLISLNQAQQTYFDALIDEDQSQIFDQPLRTQLKSKIRALLSASDWDAIGQAATEEIHEQWIQFSQDSQTAS